MPNQPNSLIIVGKPTSVVEKIEQQHAWGSHIRRIKGGAWLLAQQFGRRTTIHGLSRLLATRASLMERLIWFLTFLFAFWCAVNVCLLISHRYQEARFQTVVDSTSYPVYKIPFPVITICNFNNLNWKRIDEAKRRFLPGVKDRKILQLFERIVSAFDNVTFGRFESFAQLQNQPLERLNHINFSMVVDFMTWHCDEILEKCYWRNKKYHCCDIFTKRRSKNGLCWAFNTLASAEGKLKGATDSYYPWRVGSSGPTSAFVARILVNTDKHFPHKTGYAERKGASIMITAPNAWHRDAFHVPAYTHTEIEIEPTIVFYDNNTRSVPSAQRECVFENELHSMDFKSLQGYDYKMANCQSECHQEYLVQNCNCTVDLFFPPGPYRACRLIDLPCLAQRNDYFSYSHVSSEDKYVFNPKESMICNCFRSCWTLNYITDVRTTFLPTRLYGNASFIDLDVHFRFDTMIVYRTSLIFGWVDLIVSFGGIAGLFLGCSLISGMELAYFLIFEVPQFTWPRLKEKMLRARGAGKIQTHNTRHPRYLKNSSWHQTKYAAHKQDAERIFY